MLLPDKAISHTQTTYGMHSISRIRASWQAMQSKKPLPPTRRSILRSSLAILLVTAGTVIIIFFVSLHITQLLPPRNGNPRYHFKEDAFKHFAHHRKCSITQSSLYQIPSPKVTLLTSPFCKNKATLLTAINDSSRNNINRPFVGKNCTYKWFSAAEMCMILERHNAVTFIGDETAKKIYMALNILLSEDLELGGLQNWRIDEKERVNCRCGNQFSGEECSKYAVKSSEETQRNGGKANAYFCGRVKHAYIPISTTPASPASVTHFKDLTYQKPHPWQPSPLIFSLATGIATTKLALAEWAFLAAGAERNIPMLFLGAPATGDTIISSVEKEQEDIARVAKEMHFDVMGLSNLTVEVSEKSGMGVALVEAMIVVNWLSKIPSS